MFFDRDNPSSWSGRASLFLLAAATAASLTLGGCSSQTSSPNEPDADGGATTLLPAKSAASDQVTEVPRQLPAAGGVRPVPSPHPNALVAPTAGGSAAGPAQAPTPLAQTAGTPAEVAGVSPDFTGASQPNNLDTFNTPDCEACQSSCLTNVECQITPFCEQACMGGCMIPEVGGCMENVCPVQNGVAACDRNETCCGSVCCGPGTVCGDPNLGVCCPADNPVACGDQTQQWCYAPGTTCCSNADACPSGTQCTNVTGTSATCCPPAQTTTSGQCCEKDTCNGECCDTGTCFNGSCCEGTVVNGQCCGLAQTVCNGQCCTGSCTSSGACCAPGNTVCGSACCGGTEVCLNASTSTCGIPTSPTLTLSSSSGLVLGHSGGATVNVLAGNPYTLSGQAWSPGEVLVYHDAMSPADLMTKPNASGGAYTATFSTPITFNLTSGTHTILVYGSRGSNSIISSKIVINVAHIQ
jgi:hypothetical protein